MTTGTKTVDLTVTSQLDCGPAQCGFFFQKTWSGADYPPEPNRTKNDWSQIQPTTNGNVLGGPAVWEVVKFRTPPKRATVEDHSYSATWREYLDPEMRWFHSALGWKRGSIHSCFGLPVHADPWTTQDDLYLLGKLRGVIAGSEWNAGVMLGEGHKTLQMIGDNALRIAKSIRLLRKGSFHEAAQNLGVRILSPKRPVRTYPVSSKGVAGRNNGGASLADVDVHREISARWLELQYGWLPLLSDVKNGAEFLAHHLNTPLQKRVVVRRNAGGMRTQDTRDRFPSNYTFHPDHSLTISRSQIIAYISEKDVPQLAGLTDPLSVAWELVPFSFVFDWFIPIGNWLSARGLAQALTGKFVTTHTYKYECRYHKSQRLILGVYKIDSPSYYYKAGNISRVVSTTLAIPKPEIKPLAKSLSWAHCENAVALLIQMGSKPSGRS